MSNYQKPSTYIQRQNQPTQKNQNWNQNYQKKMYQASNNYSYSSKNNQYGNNNLIDYRQPDRNKNDNFDHLKKKIKYENQPDQFKNMQNTIQEMMGLYSQPIKTQHYQKNDYQNTNNQTKDQIQSNNNQNPKDQNITVPKLSPVKFNQISVQKISNIDDIIQQDKNQYTEKPSNWSVTISQNNILNQLKIHNPVENQGQPKINLLTDLYQIYIPAKNQNEKIQQSQSSEKKYSDQSLENVLPINFFQKIQLNSNFSLSNKTKTNEQQSIQNQFSDKKISNFSNISDPQSFETFKQDMKTEISNFRYSDGVKNQYQSEKKAEKIPETKQNEVNITKNADYLQYVEKRTQEKQLEKQKIYSQYKSELDQLIHKVKKDTLPLSMPNNLMFHYSNYTKNLELYDQDLATFHLEMVNRQSALIDNTEYGLTEASESSIAQQCRIFNLVNQNQMEIEDEDRNFEESDKAIVNKQLSIYKMEKKLCLDQKTKESQHNLQLLDIFIS